MSRLPQNTGVEYRRVRKADLVRFLAFKHLEDIFCFLFRRVHLVRRVSSDVLVDEEG
jgi:hypothetical protein